MPGQQVVDPFDLAVRNSGEGVGEPSVGIDGVQFGRLDQGAGDGRTFPPDSDPTKRQFFLPRAMGRMPRSAVLLSNSSMPWSGQGRRRSIRLRAYRIAQASSAKEED